MGNVPVNEAFPSGFVYDYAGSNWNFPTAGGTTANNVGEFFDNISAAYATTPPSILPQNPLGSTLVLHGTQQMSVGPVLVDTFSHAHFQDHGGYN